MRVRHFIFLILLVSLIGTMTVACNAKSETPKQISVDKNITVTVYSTVEKVDTVEIVLPCLLEETVHVSELLKYPDDDGITMPFTLSDAAKYAEITENNLEKRIAISVNGRVLSTPVVKMKIENGACSVMLDENQTKTLFPTINIDELKSTDR